MSFGIMRAFFKRLKARGIVTDLPELTSNLRQFQAQENRYEQVIHEIFEEERPPMIEIAAYREKFGLDQ